MRTPTYLLELGVGTLLLRFHKIVLKDPFCWNLFLKQIQLRKLIRKYTFVNDDLRASLIFYEYVVFVLVSVLWLCCDVLIRVN